MPELCIRLFGKFSATLDDRPLDGLTGTRAQELLAFLALRRDRMHPREALAELLWADAPSGQAKKYLRQALWQVQSAFEPWQRLGGAPPLLAETEWLQFNPAVAPLVDVAVFERLCAPLRGVPGRLLTRDAAATLRAALALYGGDLLDGCYQDWCIFERERLQSVYLAMLDKLTAYCESDGRYEDGIALAETALRFDHANERTHRRLMLLRYMLGDRTAALRQFDRCRRALKVELGVEPSRATATLYEQIRADRLTQIAGAEPQPALLRALARLNELHDLVGAIRSEFVQDTLPGATPAHPA